MCTYGGMQHEIRARARLASCQHTRSLCVIAPHTRQEHKEGAGVIRHKNPRKLEARLLVQFCPRTVLIQK